MRQNGRSCDNSVTEVGVDIAAMTEKAEQNLAQYLQIFSGIFLAVRLHFLISLVVFAGLAVIAYFWLKSYLFAILFFVFSIPIIGGVVARGIRLDIDLIRAGIQGVVNYIPQVIRDISQAKRPESEAGPADLSTVSSVAIDMVVYSAVKRWAGTNYLRNLAAKWIQRGILPFRRKLETELAAKNSLTLDNLLAKLDRITTDSLRVLDVSFGSVKALLNLVIVITFGLGGLLILLLAGLRMGVRF